MKHPIIRRIMTAFVAMTVMATVLSTAPTVAHAHGDHGAHDIKRDAKHLVRYGTWWQGEGGGTGSDGFWYTYSRSSRAYWYFGNLRGVFKASYYYPGSNASKNGTCGLFDSRCLRRAPTASPKIEIQEQNYSGKWVTVHTLVDTYKSSRRGKWVSWINLDLNAPIRARISKRDNDNSSRLAADSFKFQWQDNRTIELQEAPILDIAWEKWTFPFDDDDVEFWWQEVSRAQQYEIEWRYLGFDTKELRKVYERLFSDISQRERADLQSKLQDLEEGYEVKTISGDSRPSPYSEPDAECWVSSKRCEQWNGRTDAFNPDLPKHRVHSLQTHLLFQTRVRAVAANNRAGPWSDWTSFLGMRESITCVAFDIYNIIKDIQLALKAADFVLTVGAIGAAILSGGTAAASGAALKQVLKELAKAVVEKGVVKQVIKHVVKPLIKMYLKTATKTAALRIFKVLAGCVTAGFELDGSHSKSLWKDILALRGNVG